MSESDSSLRSLFAAATALQAQLDKLQSNSDAYRQQLASTLAAFTECQHLADSLSLFSPNETADDIATGDLPYLAIDYHLASLLPLTPPSAAAAAAGFSSSSATEERRGILQSAQEHYSNFLERLNAYGLLGGADKKLLKRFAADRDHFEVLAGGGGGGVRDATARREAKVARFKQERELRQRVEQLSSSASSIVHDVNGNDDDDDDSDQPRRSHAIAQLSLFVHQTFHALDQLAQELRMLELAASAPPLLQAAPSQNSQDSNSGDSRARPNSTAAYSERLDILPGLHNRNRNGPLLDRKGKPTQPFVLLDARSQLQKGVFRPGHNLPTMSIDEYLEAEKARGGIIDGGGGGNTDEPQEVDEDDLEAADRETMKQRAWDEFVEANPKGSGNTLNRG